MPSKLRNTLILILCLFAWGQTGAAYKPEIEPINESYGNFAIEAEYDRSQAYAGNDNLRLKITITTTSETQNLILDSCTSPDETKIQLRSLSNNPQPAREESGLKTTYFYQVDIKGDSPGKEGAFPTIYPLQLNLRHPSTPDDPSRRKPSDIPIIKRILELNVGVRNKGKLIINTGEDAPPEFLTSQDGVYTVEVVNNFPKYPITIRQVEIKSEPPGLIVPATILMDKRLDPMQQKPVDVHFKVADMTYKNLLSGFGDSAYLILSFTYDDSNDRVITDLKQKVKIKVRPSGRFLILAMVFGVFVGTGLKYILQGITSEKVFRYVATTILFGLVVCVFALLGKVKIIAFEATGSYDIPAVIFVIGVIAAGLGAQILSNLFGISESKKDQMTPRENHPG